MKNVLKSAFFFAAMFALTVGCQSKKTESTENGGTETVIESETLVNGDSSMTVSDTATLVPDSTSN